MSAHSTTNWSFGFVLFLLDAVWNTWWSGVVHSAHGTYFCFRGIFGSAVLAGPHFDNRLTAKSTAYAGIAHGLSLS